MVLVRLARDWTDAAGERHAAGDMIEVDAAALPVLRADGVLEGAEGEDGAPSNGRFFGPSWAGPSEDPEFY